MNYGGAYVMRQEMSQKQTFSPMQLSDNIGHAATIHPETIRLMNRR
jgi:hypothetical protein